MITASGIFRWWVVCGRFLRHSESRVAHKIRRTPNRRSKDPWRQPDWDTAGLAAPLSIPRSPFHLRPLSACPCVSHSDSIMRARSTPLRSWLDCAARRISARVRSNSIRSKKVGTGLGPSPEDAGKDSCQTNAHEQRGAAISRHPADNLLICLVSGSPGGGSSRRVFLCRSVVHFAALVAKRKAMAYLNLVGKPLATSAPKAT